MQVIIFRILTDDQSFSLRSKRFRLLLCVLVNGARRTFSAKVGARAKSERRREGRGKEGNACRHTLPSPPPSCPFFCLPQPSRSQKAETTIARTENPSHIPYGNACYAGYQSLGRQTVTMLSQCYQCIMLRTMLTCDQAFFSFFRAKVGEKRGAGKSAERKTKIRLLFPLSFLPPTSALSGEKRA